MLRAGPRYRREQHVPIFSADPGSQIRERFPLIAHRGGRVGTGGAVLPRAAGRAVSTMGCRDSPHMPMTLTLDTHADPQTGPVVEVVPVPFAKRLLDLVLASIGLLLSSPLWFALAALVKIEDGGPVFYSQERVGEGGRVFRAWKFRSMITDAEKYVGALQAAHNDPRVTRIGRVMRGTRDGRTAAALEHLRRRHELRRAARPAARARSRCSAAACWNRSRTCLATAIAAACVQGSPASRRSTRLATSRAGTSSVTIALYIAQQSLWLDVRLIALSFWITFRGRWEARDAKI